VEGGLAGAQSIPPPGIWQNWLQIQPDLDQMQVRTLRQLASQQIGGHNTIALATLGVRPTPRLPASIDTPTTSFTIFLRMTAPSKVDSVPETPVSERACPDV
jgi:hypothetical protein